jgi:hypothetical protein
VQRRRSEYLGPGTWGVDETNVLYCIENDRSKKAVHMHDNPTRQDTHSDAGQTMNGNFPVLSTDCEKVVIW